MTESESAALPFGEWATTKIMIHRFGGGVKGFLKKAAARPADLAYLRRKRGFRRGDMSILTDLRSLTKRVTHGIFSL